MTECVECGAWKAPDDLKQRAEQAERERDAERERADRNHRLAIRPVSPLVEEQIRLLKIERDALLAKKIVRTIHKHENQPDECGGIQHVHADGTTTGCAAPGDWCDEHREEIVTLRRERDEARAKVERLQRFVDAFDATDYAAISRELAETPAGNVHHGKETQSVRALGIARAALEDSK